MEESKPKQFVESNHSKPGATPMRTSIYKENNCDYELMVSGRKGEFKPKTEHETGHMNCAFNQLIVKGKNKDLLRVDKKKDDSPRPRH